MKINKKKILLFTLFFLAILICSTSISSATSTKKTIVKKTLMDQDMFLSAPYKKPTKGWKYAGTSKKKYSNYYVKYYKCTTYDKQYTKWYKSYKVKAKYTSGSLVDYHTYKKIEHQKVTVIWKQTWIKKVTYYKVKRNVYRTSPNYVEITRSKSVISNIKVNPKKYVDPNEYYL